MAKVSHTFVSGIADGADATLVRPTNWNADHTVDSDELVVVGETPSGVINGVNDTFTLANTPKAGTVVLYRNGLRQQAGVAENYTISGDTITFVAGQEPQTGEWIIADYWLT